MEYKFIITTDSAISDYLINNGYQLVMQDSSKWVFINHKMINFEKNNKVVYSNILTV